MGEVTVMLELFLNFSDSIRTAVLEQTWQGIRKLDLLKTLVWKQVWNNHGILILIDLWRKTKQWLKKYEKMTILYSDLQLYQKETPTQIFSWQYCEIYKNSYFEEHLWRVGFESFSFYVNLNVFLYKQITYQLHRKWRRRFLKNKQKTF